RAVPIDAIDVNPYQPRTTMDSGALDELAQSIRAHGVVQPLLVVAGREPGTYLLIAGERRWRAARRAGLDSVPVVVMDLAPQQMLEIALVENIVRADLSPLEEAHAYRRLGEDFGLTQAQIAERVGRSRVTITNTLRLLAAPDQVQSAIAAGQITEGHARALLGLPNATDQIAALQTVIEKQLNVRQTEDLVRRWLQGGQPAPRQAADHDARERQVEERFRSALGTRVGYRRATSGEGGTLTIQVFSEEQLNALYERLAGEDIW
ncbi:MAG TPA: ParB/RepB/Spo0J family partition protein, partial [Candidatus Limnocylindria bacterium]|nr:ParB/RepB/Spo0J family partition protein [Candidatus Limnocylindria bacterium]